MAAWINCGWTHLRVISSTSVALSTVAITIQYNGNTEQTIFFGINSMVIYKDRSQIQIENIYLFCRSSFQPGTYSTLFSHPVHLVLSQNKICFLNLTTECTKDGQYFFFPFVIFFSFCQILQIQVFVIWYVITMESRKSFPLNVVGRATRV